MLSRNIKHQYTIIGKVIVYENESLAGHRKMRTCALFACDGTFTAQPRKFKQVFHHQAKYRSTLCLDCLAKISVDNELGLCVLQVVPEYATSIILDDMTGLVRLLSIRAAPAAV